MSLAQDERIDWVDYAKGFCIVMVVMMHSTLGVEAALGQEGWMHHVVAFAKPFRMPDFFLISGLFLARVIERDWRTYLDRKVVHFVYFYVLWVTIQFAVKAPGLAVEQGWAASPRSISKPSSSRSAPCGSSTCCRSSSSLTKLTRRVPTILVWLIAGRARDRADRNRLDAGRRVRRAASSISTPATGSPHTSSRIAATVTGAAVPRHGMARHLGRAQWLSTCATGLPSSPIVSLIAGLHRCRPRWSRSRALLAKSTARALRYCGRNSIVIYLAFFLSMAATTGRPDQDPASSPISARFRSSSRSPAWSGRSPGSGRCAGPPLRFLFEPPARLWLAPKRLVLQPAE